MRIELACLALSATLALGLGCGSKGRSQAIQPPPLAIREPHEVLQQLQYLGTRHDLKQIPVMTAVELGDLYNNGRWFHDHAGQMNLTMDAREFQALGLQPLQDMGYLAPGVSKKALQEAIDATQGQKGAKLPAGMEGLDPDKLDKLPLPGEKDAERARDAALIRAKYLRPVFYAGIRRLVKGVPEALWGEMRVVDSRPSKENTRWHEVYLGLEGKPVLQVTLTRQPNGTYGIIYMFFKVSPRKLEMVAAQMAGQK